MSSFVDSYWLRAIATGFHFTAMIYEGPSVSQLPGTDKDHMQRDERQDLAGDTDRAVLAVRI